MSAQSCYEGTWLLVPELPTATCLALVAHLSAPGLGRAGQYKFDEIVLGFPASYCRRQWTKYFYSSWTSSFLFFVPRCSSIPTIPLPLWNAWRHSYTSSECTLPLVPEAAASWCSAPLPWDKNVNGRSGNVRRGIPISTQARDHLCLLIDYLFVIKKDAVKTYIAIQKKLFCTL